MERPTLSTETPKPGEACGCSEPAIHVCWTPVHSGVAVTVCRQVFCEACAYVLADAIGEHFAAEDIDCSPV